METKNRPWLQGCLGAIAVFVVLGVLFSVLILLGPELYYRATGEEGTILNIGPYGEHLPTYFFFIALGVGVVIYFRARGKK